MAPDADQKYVNSISLLTFSLCVYLLDFLKYKSFF